MRTKSFSIKGAHLLAFFGLVLIAVAFYVELQTPAPAEPQSSVIWQDRIALQKRSAQSNYYSPPPGTFEEKITTQKRTH